MKPLIGVHARVLVLPVEHVESVAWLTLRTPAAWRFCNLNCICFAPHFTTSILAIAEREISRKRICCDRSLVTMSEMILLTLKLETGLKRTMKVEQRGIGVHEVRRGLRVHNQMPPWIFRVVLLHDFG